MPFYDDHPVRLLLLRTGLKQAELARMAGVTTGAVDKLVMGMTKTVNPAVAGVLASRTGVAPSEIASAVEEWNEKPIRDRISNRARATLLLEAGDIPRFYSSFRMWRLEFADNPTQFASMVRVPRATVKEFEDGLRKVMPPTLHTALVRAFDLTDEQVTALARLPHPEVAR